MLYNVVQKYDGIWQTEFIKIDKTDSQFVKYCGEHSRIKLIDVLVFIFGAIVLNSPWSMEKYDVRWARGIVSAGELSSLDCEKMYWMGTLRSDTDGLSAECYGYAEDPVDALAMCIEKFKLIQSKFNPEDDSI